MPLNPTRDHKPRSLIALDFGLRRIGVASGSAITGTASPLTTIAAQAGTPDWKQLDTIISDWSPDLLVLGLPYNTDGSESDMAQKVREFSEDLKARYSLPIAFMDERYTSAEAESLLKQQRRSGMKKRRLKKEDVDSLAAALIAQSWIQNSTNGSD